MTAWNLVKENLFNAMLTSTQLFHVGSGTNAH